MKINFFLTKYLTFLHDLHSAHKPSGLSFPVNPACLGYIWMNKNENNVTACCDHFTFALLSSYPPKSQPLQPLQHQIFSTLHSYWTLIDE